MLDHLHSSLLASFCCDYGFEDHLIKEKQLQIKEMRADLSWDKTS